MPDRSPSRPTPATLFPALAPAAGRAPAARPGPEHGAAVLLREHQPSPPRERSDVDADERGASGGAGDSGGRDGERDGRRGADAEDNPFAPPPEGAPDRPWRPRHNGGQNGQGDSGGQGGRNPWGQWSNQQPGRSQGPFGERPGRQGGPEGPGQQSRWDPTDPAQRRARYALLSGTWGFFFALFDWPFRSWFFGGGALLLASLALYWAISSLRTRPRTPDPDAPPAPSQPPASAGGGPTGGPTGGPAGRRQQRTAAVTGLVTASLTMTLLASAFAARIAYDDFYTCTSDALTLTARQNCDNLLPKDLRSVLGNQD